MKNSFITVSLFVVLMISGGGQLQSQPDMMEKLRETEELVASGKLSDADLFQKYDDLMWDYHPIDVKKTHYYFRKALAFAQKKKNVEEESKCLKRMGIIYNSWGSKDSVLFYLDRALGLIKGKEYYLEESHNHETRGNYYLRLNSHEKAMDAYLKALELIEKEKMKKKAEKQEASKILVREAFILYNISNIYAQRYNFDSYFEHLLHAKKILDDNPSIDFKSLEYILPGSIAEYYLTTKQDDKALPFMKENYRLASEKKAYSSMVYALNRLTNYYRVRNRGLAFKYAKEALEIAETTKIPYLLNLAEGTLSKTYIHAGDYQAALYHTQRSLERTEEDDWVALENLYGDLVLIYALMGDRNKAEIYLDKYRDLLIKISDENLHNALQEMEVKYKTTEKELEIVHKQAEIDKHKTRQYIFIAGLCLAALIVILLIYIVRLNRKRNKELKEINATKDRFFSIISHDVKNPAIAQRNALQTLVQNEHNLDSETLSQYYTELLKSADYQVDLLYSLLNWAQVQTGRMPYDPVTFDLKEAICPEIAMIENIAAKKSIDLQIKMPDELLVTGDRNMITIVIRNLLTNAIKFTHENGKITFDVSPSENGYKISISDTGTGINAQQLQHLFQIDKQQSKTGTAGEQGSGLGLLVSKEFVEKHGSVLYVDSLEGKGSSFWFEVRR